MPAPDLRAGQNAKAALFAARGALFKANCRLAADGVFYAGVRAAFGANKEPGHAAQNAADPNGCAANARR